MKDKIENLILGYANAHNWDNWNHEEVRELSKNVIELIQHRLDNPLD